MNKEIKEKWVAALRSGEYEQGKGMLKTEDGKYCCLGVLCDLYSKEKESNEKFELSEDVYSFIGTSGVLPREVREWAGIDTPNPIVASGDRYESLATFNDGIKGSIDSISFKEIADLIEAQL